MSRPRRRRTPLPYIPDPNAPPLREVVAALGPANQKLVDLDRQIANHLAALEYTLQAIPVERVYSVKLSDGADLGWSRDRKSKRWRFVIRDGEDITELRSASNEERIEVLTCGAMEKLFALAGIHPKTPQPPKESP